MTDGEVTPTLRLYNNNNLTNRNNNNNSDNNNNNVNDNVNENKSIFIRNLIEKSLRTHSTIDGIVLHLKNILNRNFFKIQKFLKPL